MQNNGFTIPDYTHEATQASAHIRAFANGESTFIHHLLPGDLVKLDDRLVLDALAKKLGYKTMQNALDPNQRIDSPVHKHQNAGWLQSTNMVGVNVRTIKHFWNLVKYALSLPESQDSIHLLPIWEPGVVSSLYGMASWNINPEFYSPQMAQLVPQLDTVEKQLIAVVNLLHAMGKTVGMDVIPHTDRYSEIALAHPHYFEWLERTGLTITNHEEKLHKRVQRSIMDWLIQEGAADPTVDFPLDTRKFFDDTPEALKYRVLFGQARDYRGRQDRRASLVDWLYRRGLEPVPASMGPPYRGIEVDPDPAAMTIDHAKREWRDYRITAPQAMSRVFGPLTRFKFYRCKDDNADWQIDFSSPRPKVWEYFCQHYAEVQQTYNFDFMRGDMSHVQMRPEGVPAHIDDYYDPLRAVRNYVGKRVPYFGYFAESFLTAPNFMAYGDEVDHLEASDADTTLGDLQSMPVGSPDFMAHFRRYIDLNYSRRVKPNFTLMTADKDDPRFDGFYLHGNEARMFIGLFLTDMPSYMALGFEQRDPHPAPVDNEYYTKLYVFQVDEGPKATSGPYKWGENTGLFYQLSRIRQFADLIFPMIKGKQTMWLQAPDPTAGNQILAWTQAEQPSYLFIANLHPALPVQHLRVPLPEHWPKDTRFKTVFRLQKYNTDFDLQCSRRRLFIEEFPAGELAVIRID